MTRIRADCADCGGLTPPRSGQMSGERQSGRLRERLVDDAIALGQPQQCLQLLVGRVSVEVEAGANGREPDRRLLVDAEGAAEVQIALDVHRATAELDADRCR